MNIQKEEKDNKRREKGIDKGEEKKGKSDKQDGEFYMNILNS